MKKNKFVKFVDGKNARVYMSDDPKFMSGPGVHVNPDLSAVKGKSPEFWREKDGKIVAGVSAEAVSKIVKQAKHHNNIGKHLAELDKKIKVLQIVTVLIITGLLLTVCML